MFFPRSPNLPTVGDTVCFRYCHEPYTVGMVTPCNTLYHLSGIDAPVRLETLAWYPQVGDNVEVLFAPHIRYLEGKLADYNARYWTTPPQDRAPIERTIQAIKGAMKKAINYRTGTLLRIDRGLVQVGFQGAKPTPIQSEIPTSDHGCRDKNGNVLMAWLTPGKSEWWQACEFALIQSNTLALLQAARAQVPEIRLMQVLGQWRKDGRYLWLKAKESQLEAEAKHIEVLPFVCIATVSRNVNAQSVELHPYPQAS